MKKLILTIVLIEFAVVSYSQTVTYNLPKTTSNVNKATAKDSLNKTFTFKIVQTLTSGTDSTKSSSVQTGTEQWSEVGLYAHISQLQQQISQLNTAILVDKQKLQLIYNLRK